MVDKYHLFSSCISCVYHDIQKIERMEMEKYGLKGPHAQCLLIMGLHPEGITAARLCEVCEKDKAAISRILVELEQAGMILRQSQNGTRYRATLMLTEQGRKASEAVKEKAQLAVEQACLGLNDKQQEMFYQVLSLVSRNLHTICKDGLQTEKV